jgi:hypothetical protein
MEDEANNAQAIRHPSPSRLVSWITQAITRLAWQYGRRQKQALKSKSTGPSSTPLKAASTTTSTVRIFDLVGMRVGDGGLEICFALFYFALLCFALLCGEEIEEGLEA